MVVVGGVQHLGDLPPEMPSGHQVHHDLGPPPHLLLLTVMSSVLAQQECRVEGPRRGRGECTWRVSSRAGELERCTSGWFCMG